MLSKLVFQLLYLWLRILCGTIFISQWIQMPLAACCQNWLLYAYASCPLTKHLNKLSWLVQNFAGNRNALFHQDFCQKILLALDKILDFYSKTLHTGTLFIYLLQVCLMLHENSTLQQNFVQTLWNLVLLTNQCLLHDMYTKCWHFISLFT